MKKPCFAILLLVFTLSLSAQKNEKSTYFLIRHAEKDRSDSTNKNPDLSEKGKERAIKWSEIFNKFNIEAVYSTNYARTTQTAKPTADSKNMSIKHYHPFKIDIVAFRKETQGKNVLIIGHSNTTASFANKLLGSEIYPEIKDDNNANLYIITIDEKRTSHILIKME